MLSTTQLNGLKREETFRKKDPDSESYCPNLWEKLSLLEGIGNPIWEQQPWLTADELAANLFLGPINLMERQEDPVGRLLWGAFLGQ